MNELKSPAHNNNNNKKKKKKKKISNYFDFDSYQAFKNCVLFNGPGSIFMFGYILFFLYLEYDFYNN